MDYTPNQGGSAFVKAVFVGAYTGVSIQLVLTHWGEPIILSEVWAVPLILAVYGLIAAPFVAIGLAIFGWPALRLLRDHADTLWVGLLAAVLGGAGGKLIFYAIDHLLFFGFYDISPISSLDMGIIYGVPTGLAWWHFQRRALRSQRSNDLRVSATIELPH